MAMSEGLFMLKQHAHRNMLTVGTQCAREYVDYLRATRASYDDTEQEKIRSFDPEDYPMFRAAKKVIALIEEIERS